MKSEKNKLWTIFSKIRNRQDALDMIEAVSGGFFYIAILKAGQDVVMFKNYSLLYDPAIYLAGGILLWKFKNRMVAFSLLLWTIGSLGVAIMDTTVVQSTAGANIFLAFIILDIAIRGVEATFKLHGRFKTG